MRSARAIATFAIAAVFVFAANALLRSPHETVSADDIAARAHKLHFSTYVIDTHDDTTQRFLSKSGFDLSKRYTDGSIDIPRMREGGMNGIFFSIWIDGKTMGPEAIRQALAYVPPERLFPCTNCGMAPMSASIAYSKLAALAAGAELMRKTL